MLLAILLVVVVVLFVVAMLPLRRRDGDIRQSFVGTSDQVTPPQRIETILPTENPRTSLRGQQVQEEASAIAAEYQRRADEVWLDELRGKASRLLGPERRTAPKT